MPATGSQALLGRAEPALSHHVPLFPWFVTSTTWAWTANSAVEAKRGNTKSAKSRARPTGGRGVGSCSSLALVPAVGPPVMFFTSVTGRIRSAASASSVILLKVALPTAMGTGRFHCFAMGACAAQVGRGIHLQMIAVTPMSRSRTGIFVGAQSYLLGAVCGCERTSSFRVSSSVLAVRGIAHPLLHFAGPPSGAASLPVEECSLCAWNALSRAAFTELHSLSWAWVENGVRCIIFDIADCSRFDVVMASLVIVRLLLFFFQITGTHLYAVCAGRPPPQSFRSYGTCPARSLVRVWRTIPILVRVTVASKGATVVSMRDPPPMSMRAIHRATGAARLGVW